MENLLLIFENISSVNRALIIVSGITFFWVIEGITPFKFLDYKKWRHSIPNFLLTLTTIIVNFNKAVLYIFLKISIIICVKENPIYNIAGGQIVLNI